MFIQILNSKLFFKKSLKFAFTIFLQYPSDNFIHDVHLLRNNKNEIAVCNFTLTVQARKMVGGAQHLVIRPPG